MKRKLTLRRENGAELTTDEMRGVVAGVSTNIGCWMPDRERPTEGISCVDCPSVPLTGCTILQETGTVTCPTDVC